MPFYLKVSVPNEDSSRLLLMVPKDYYCRSKKSLEVPEQSSILLILSPRVGRSMDCNRHSADWFEPRGMPHPSGSISTRTGRLLGIGANERQSTHRGGGWIGRCCDSFSPRSSAAGGNASLRTRGLVRLPERGRDTVRSRPHRAAVLAMEKEEPTAEAASSSAVVKTTRRLGHYSTFGVRKLVDDSVLHRTCLKLLYACHA